MVEDFCFSITEAETLFMALLEQHDAIRAEPGFDVDNVSFKRAHKIDQSWVSAGRAVYDLPTRTPLALFLCGLLARATDPDVDPLSIQDGSGAQGYNAAGLWANVIYKHGTDRIDLRKLKGVPFNNSPFNGKRRLATDWVNVSGKNKKAVQVLNDMLSTVSEMSPSEAQTALLSVLVAAPSIDTPRSGSRIAHGHHSTFVIPLVDFADGVANFITLNSDDGRRAQAFVAACLDVVFPGRTHTPASVNDPSRTSPGDVKTLRGKSLREPGPLYVEVKDKVTRQQTVIDFVKQVVDHDAGGSAGYAALANTPRAEASLDPNSHIQSSEELTRATGVPVIVWKSPLELLSQSVVWSARPIEQVIWEVAFAYLKWLDHIDTGKNGSPAAWAAKLDQWGFTEAAEAEEVARD